MNKEVSAKKQAIPLLIASSVFCTGVSLLSYFFVPLPLKYYLVGFALLLLLFFWIVSLRQLLSKRNWKIVINQDKFEFESPVDCCFSLSLDEIDYIKTDVMKPGDSNRYTFFNVYSRSGEEYMLPTSTPFCLFPAKVKLKKLGVKVVKGKL